MSFSLLPLVDTVTKLFPSATMDALKAALVNLDSAQTVAGIKTFSSAPVVPDDSFAIAKTTGLQDALDGIDSDITDLSETIGAIAYPTEVAADDISDPLDDTGGLVTGRRLYTGVDAATGGVQHVFWDPDTSTWGTSRASAKMRVFHSRPYADATDPLGLGPYDEWEFSS